MKSKRTTQSAEQSEPSEALFTAAPPKDWKPHAYQKKAIKFMLAHGAAALFLDPGLGKSSITLATLKLLMKAGKAEKILIIAPLRVAHSVWPRELKKWTDFTGMRAVVLHGPKKDELLEQDADLYIINHEGLPWLLSAEKSETPTGKRRVEVSVRKFKELGFDTLVIDELSKFKDSNTQRFKALKQVIPTFRHRYGLTGSPAPNGLIDLFGQAFIIDEGRSLGRFVTHYRSKYFTPAWDGFSWDLKPGAEKQIYKRLKPLALTMTAGDYLKMPKLQENLIKIDLPKKAREVYDQLEDSLYAELDEGTVVAATAAAASMKCRQVANGGVYIDDEMDALLGGLKKRRGEARWVDLHEEKVEAIADLVDELQGEPLLVAYDFEHDLARLKRRLGEKTPHIGGGVSSKRAQEIETNWNAGKVPVLLGHPQALAHGLNLQGSGFHVAWHSLTWNYELYDQFIRRVYRQGQKARTVFVHQLVAVDTIDVAIRSALASKHKGQQALFTALKTYRKGKKRNP